MTPQNPHNSESYIKIRKQVENTRTTSPQMIGITLKLSNAFAHHKMS